MTGNTLRVIAACGSSIATSTILVAKIEEFCKKYGYQLEIRKSDFYTLEKNVNEFKPDLIVASSNPRKDFGVPTFIGVPYLTGVGVEALEEKMLEAIKNS